MKFRSDTALSGRERSEYSLLKRPQGGLRARTALPGLLTLLLTVVGSPALELTHARIVVPIALTNPEKKAVMMLIEEVEKRTQIRWGSSSAWADSEQPIIAV